MCISNSPARAARQSDTRPNKQQEPARLKLRLPAQEECSPPASNNSNDDNRPTQQSARLSPLEVARLTFGRVLLSSGQRRAPKERASERADEQDRR